MAVDASDVRKVTSVVVGQSTKLHALLISRNYSTAGASLQGVLTPSLGASSARIFHMAEHAQLPVELVADPLGAPPCRLTASRTAAGKSQALVKSSLSQSLRALAALTQLPTPMDGRPAVLMGTLALIVWLNVLMDTLDQSQQGALSKAGHRQAVARQIKQAARGHRQPALTLTLSQPAVQMVTKGHNAQLPALKTTLAMPQQSAQTPTGSSPAHAPRTTATTSR